MLDLGTLGGTLSIAQDINDAGEIVGYSFTAGNTAHHAFLCTAANGLIDLGTLGGSQGYGNAIDDTGRVVGETTSGGTRAFSWTAAGGMVDLGTLDGSTRQVVGQAQTGALEDHAVIWSGPWKDFGGEFRARDERLGAAADVTNLLLDWRGGDETAPARLVPIVRNCAVWRGHGCGPTATRT